MHGISKNSKQGIKFESDPSVQLLQILQIFEPISKKGLDGLEHNWKKDEIRH